MVARAEDVHVGPRRVRLDEHELAVGRLDDAALAELEQRLRRAVEVGLGGQVAAHELLLAEALGSAPRRCRTVIAIDVSLATASAICGTSAGSSAYTATAIEPPQVRPTSKPSSSESP